MNWSGKLYQIYEERWWNTLFATTMFFEIKALRLRHPLNVGALITNWYQDVEALRTHFESFDHWWEFQKTVCGDIGDYLLIGRPPPRDRIVFKGINGIRLKSYAETFPGHRGSNYTG